jgi:hypothetical protein
MCTQKRRLEDGREGGQGPTRTVEPRIVFSVLCDSVHRQECKLNL